MSLSSTRNAGQVANTVAMCVGPKQLVISNVIGFDLRSFWNQTNNSNSKDFDMDYIVVPSSQIPVAKP